MAGAGIQRANPIEVGHAAVAGMLHQPAAGSQATITAPAAGLGFKNVCRGVDVTWAGTNTPPAAATRKVRLIDGASGGATYLWGVTLGMPAVAGSSTGVARDVWRAGAGKTA